MKTTCLIPVPVEDSASIGFPLVRNSKGMEFRATYNKELDTWYDEHDISRSGITHVYEPQSGYFFTEEEMKSLFEQWKELLTTK